MFYNVIKNIAKFILMIFYRVRVYGSENTPLDGKLILCSNHHSNWDPIFISIVFPRQISWMGKKQLFKNKLLGAFLRKLYVFPVDRDGSDVGAVKNALKVLKNDNVLGIFPEGTRVRSMDLNNAKSGVALLAYKSKSPIVPIYIQSDYKIFKPVNIYIGEVFEINDVIDNKPNADDYIYLSKYILKRIYDIKS